MPRHPTAKKDAASCEKPRGGASDLGSGDVRMGEPLRRRPETRVCGGEVGEVKHLSSRIEKKSKRYPE